MDWQTATDPDLLGRMVARISHRGPDSEGVWLAGPVALGHRRLSIIDTSAAGTQPLADVTGRYRIVFNGEIYNFEALRAELVATGAVLATRTDTEVILEAYKKWGIDCLTRFNGMFAFALWDTVRAELLLARDRLGKKPLYYQLLPGGGIAFASELKSLLEDPATSRRLNPAALSQYFSLSYTLTSDAIISGVAKLPPGHYLRVGRAGATAPVSYWDLARSFRNKRDFRSEEAAADELLEL
ncbi:MAG: asparagine synthetase B family protein, partial [Acidobacteriota bacterium]